MEHEKPFNIHVRKKVRLIIRQIHDLVVLHVFFNIKHTNMAVIYSTRKQGLSDWFPSDFLF